MSVTGRRALIAVSLAAAVALVFAPAAHFGFIELDDHGYVADNPMVTNGLSAAGIVWALTTFQQANWHPLTWMSLMGDASLFGPRPQAFHNVNIACHAAAAILLFLWVARATGCGGPAAAAALLFALHPLRVESVVWIAERKDVLSGALGFASLYAWIAWTRRPSAGRYAVAAGLFVLGLMAKPMLVVLPLLMVLLDRWPLDRFDPVRSVVEKIPFFAGSAACAVVTLVAQRHGGAVSTLGAIPLATRLSNAAVVSVDYFWKTLWPRDLATPYPYDPGRLQPLRVAACVVVLGAVTTLALRAWKTRPHLAVAWAWYLVSLLPVIGLVQVGRQAMADRYTYLALVGPVVGIVWELHDRLASRFTVLCIGILTAALAVATHRQVMLWRDSETLFTHAITVTGPNTLAHQALGRALYRNGRTAQAIEELGAAVAIDPRNAQAWKALGEARLDGGQTDEAIAAYANAIRHGEDDPALRTKLAAALTSEGALRLRAGDLTGSESALRRALEVSDDNAPAHAALGVLLARTGRLDEAERELSAALRHDPGNAGFQANLERVRAMKR